MVLLIEFEGYLISIFIKMQEAVKCMRHSKRTVLTSIDVDNALKLRNLEVTYGNAVAAFFSFTFCVSINMASNWNLIWVFRATK